MKVADPALMMEVAKGSRTLSRLVVSNSVFALMTVLLLLGSLTLQLAGDPSESKNGAPAYGE
ncbi:MAG: hypothetical protein WB646_07865 [Steroidobacteraceae bacterium]